MSHNHLNIDERCCIYNFLNSGLSIREIAKALQRSPSTISREIKKNSHRISKIYYPEAAERKYHIRRKECHNHKLNDNNVIEYIEEKIHLRWSPEQISHRICDNENLNIPSTATIYRMIHDKRIPKVEMIQLRRKGHFKRPAETRGKFNVSSSRSIKKRPKDIYKRLELGHWEGDTVESGRNDHTRKSSVCFVTLAERKSRFYIAIKVPSRKECYVTPAIIEALKQFPSELVKTITFDRGKEFAGYEKIEQELHCNTYFCDPYCAWQKGTNENTNGLLREFYPKGMDLSKVDIDELTNNLSLLNNRPRKCNKYLTPLEVLNT
ncbi:MAG: IS30 family transposase [Bacilli bacterium]|nr:IS30 family transposase [Bacilli bacterium]